MYWELVLMYFFSLFLYYGAVTTSLREISENQPLIGVLKFATCTINLVCFTDTVCIIYLTFRHRRVLFIFGLPLNSCLYCTACRAMYWYLYFHSWRQIHIAVYMVIFYPMNHYHWSCAYYQFLNG